MKRKVGFFVWCVQLFLKENCMETHKNSLDLYREGTFLNYCYSNGPSRFIEMDVSFRLIEGSFKKVSRIETIFETKKKSYGILRININWKIEISSCSK